MPKLKFRYSPIYDDMLFRAAGKSFPESKKKEGEKLRDQIGSSWKRYETKTFAYVKKLGLSFAKEEPVFLIHPQPRVTSYSDPFTILINKKIDLMLLSVVHELSHNILDYSSKIGDKIWRHLTKNFSAESNDVRIHLPVEILMTAILGHIFPKKKVKSLLQYEKKISGLKRPWKIIRKQKVNFNDPIRSILNLKKV